MFDPVYFVSIVIFKVCPVCAVTDCVGTLAGCGEDVSKVTNLSTFMITEVNHLLNNCTKETLVRLHSLIKVTKSLADWLITEYMHFMYLPLCFHPFYRQPLFTLFSFSNGDNIMLRSLNFSGTVEARPCAFRVERTFLFSFAKILIEKLWISQIMSP